jgi:hypothetical protein
MVINSVRRIMIKNLWVKTKTLARYCYKMAKKGAEMAGNKGVEKMAGKNGGKKWGEKWRGKKWRGKKWREKNGAEKNGGKIYFVKLELNQKLKIEINQKESFFLVSEAD